MMALCSMRTMVRGNLVAVQVTSGLCVLWDKTWGMPVYAAKVFGRGRYTIKELECKAELLYEIAGECVDSEFIRIIPAANALCEINDDTLYVGAGRLFFVETDQDVGDDYEFQVGGVQ